MLHLSSSLNVNSLIWITSLNPDERGTTVRVHEDLDHVFASIGLPFESVEPKTASELFLGLDAIARKAAEGLRPIIHLDTHGSADRGLRIAESGESVSWPELVRKLRAINIETRNSLCVVSAACFGMHVIKSLSVAEAVPFFILIAPEQAINFKFTETRTVGFYEDVFRGLDIVSAYENHLAASLGLFHCEKMLAIALTRYVRDHCMGKGLAERRENLMSQSISGGVPNTRENRRLIRSTTRTLIRPDQALIDRYVDRFLIGKTVPFAISDVMRLAKAAKAAEERTERRKLAFAKARPLRKR